MRILNLQPNKESGTSMMSTLIALLLLATILVFSYDSLTSNTKFGLLFSTQEQHKTILKTLHTVIGKGVGQFLRDHQIGGTCVTAGTNFSSLWPAVNLDKANIQLAHVVAAGDIPASFDANAIALAAKTRCQNQTFSSSVDLTGKTGIYFCLTIDPNVIADVEGDHINFYSSGVARRAFLEVYYEMYNLESNQSLQCSTFTGNSVGGHIYFTIYWQRLIKDEQKFYSKTIYLPHYYR